MSNSSRDAPVASSDNFPAVASLQHCAAADNGFGGLVVDKQDRRR
jgi:hypothetical protein